MSNLDKSDTEDNSKKDKCFFSFILNLFNIFSNKNVTENEKDTKSLLEALIEEQPIEEKPIEEQPN